MQLETPKRWEFQRRAAAPGALFGGGKWPVQHHQGPAIARALASLCGPGVGADVMMLLQKQRTPNTPSNAQPAELGGDVQHAGFP